MASSPVTHDFEWDQRETLRPPPFQGPLMKRILGGLEVGDPPFDGRPSSSSCGFSPSGKGSSSSSSMETEASWIDWASVRRGQEAYASHLGSFAVIGNLGLLHGFTIARFGEVLHHTGYSESPMSAFERYRETGFAILDWILYPLDEPEGRARTAIRNVRAMHSLARRRSMRLFDRSKGEGIALSQYDMAIVHLGFAGVSLHLLETVILGDGGGSGFTSEEKEDIVHAWRVIGHFLGIQEEYNVCANGYEELDATVREFLRFVPNHFATCRERSTFALQRTAIEGFGAYTGLGAEVFVGMLHAVGQEKAEVDYMQRKPLPGMRRVGRWCLRAMGTPPMEAIARFLFPRIRERWRSHPAETKWFVSHLPIVGRGNDAILWRVASRWPGKSAVIIVIAVLMARWLARRWRVVGGGVDSNGNGIKSVAPLSA